MGYEHIKELVAKRGKKKVANNTYLQQWYVKYGPLSDYVVMNLHGNTVARFDIEGVELFSCGWCTPTTKDRLNFALQLAGIPLTVYQKNWQWFIGKYTGGDLPFYEGVKLLYGGI